MSQPDGDLDSAVLQENLQGELSVREEVLDVLLEKVRTDRYPSSSMLDDIERLLTPWRRDDYAEALLDKIRQDRFPSHALIQRAVRLSG